MRHQRKTAPEVVGGRVQKKNNREPHPSDYYATPQNLPVVDRKRPGAGYRHFLTKRDIHAFIGILPDWDMLSEGLNAVVLAPGSRGADGYHTPGVVHVCAWDARTAIEVDSDYYEDHRDIFERLGVPCEPVEGWYRCGFTAATVRAYQLLHILLHELGHHHDRMTTRKRRSSSRGEGFAEEYARQYEAHIWSAYVRTFGLF